MEKRRHHQAIVHNLTVERAGEDEPNDLTGLQGRKVTQPDVLTALNMVLLEQVRAHFSMRKKLKDFIRRRDCFNGGLSMEETTRQGLAAKVHEKSKRAQTHCPLYGCKARVANMAKHLSQIHGGSKEEAGKLTTSYEKTKKFIVDMVDW